VFLYILSERVFTFFFKNVILKKQIKKEFRLSLLKKKKKHFLQKFLRKEEARKILLRSTILLRCGYLNIIALYCSQLLYFSILKLKRRKKLNQRK